MSPEDTIEYLKSITSSKAHATLDRVYEVCQGQLKRGVNDFSISTIAKLGSEHGIPKAQSIRNKTGVHYRELIHSFEKMYCKDKGLTKRKGGKEDWISSISDMQLRLQVNIIHSELKRAKTLIKELIPPNQEICIYDNTNSLKEEFKLNQLERDALAYLISDLFLIKFGFSRGSNGSIVDSSGKRVFPAATQDAIQKALNSL